MNKIWKLFQYGYLLIAAFFLIDGILKFNSDRSKAVISLFFAIFITLVFFLKRHFRKKVEKRNNQNK